MKFDWWIEESGPYHIFSLEIGWEKRNFFGENRKRLEFFLHRKNKHFFTKRRDNLLRLIRNWIRMAVWFKQKAEKENDTKIMEKLKFNEKYIYICSRKYLWMLMYYLLFHPVNRNDHLNILDWEIIEMKIYETNGKKTAIYANFHLIHGIFVCNKLSIFF